MSLVWREPLGLRGEPDKARPTDARYTYLKNAL
jgi:hypothetical protein